MKLPVKTQSRTRNFNLSLNTQFQLAESERLRGLIATWTREYNQLTRRFYDALDAEASEQYWEQLGPGTRTYEDQMDRLRGLDK